MKELLTENEGCKPQNLWSSHSQVFIFLKGKPNNSRRQPWLETTSRRGLVIRFVLSTASARCPHLLTMTTFLPANLHPSWIQARPPKSTEPNSTMPTMCSWRQTTNAFPLPGHYSLLCQQFDSEWDRTIPRPCRNCHSQTPQMLAKVAAPASEPSLACSLPQAF